MHICIQKSVSKNFTCNLFLVYKQTLTPALNEIKHLYYSQSKITKFASKITLQKISAPDLFCNIFLSTFSEWLFKL